MATSKKYRLIDPPLCSQDAISKETFIAAVKAVCVKGTISNQFTSQSEQEYCLLYEKQKAENSFAAVRLWKFETVGQQKGSDLTASYHVFNWTTVEGLNEKIRKLLDAYESEKFSVLEFLGNSNHHLDLTVKNEILKRIGAINCTMVDLEIRDHETLIFTLRFEYGQKISIRYHVTDPSRSLFSYFKGTSFISNGVGDFDAVLLDVTKIIANDIETSGVKFAACNFANWGDELPSQIVSFHQPYSMNALSFRAVTQE